VTTTPWLYNRLADSLFLLAPAFLVTLAVELAPASWLREQQLKNEAWAWLLLVVCIDVAHVYSTLWRTYFDRESVEKYRSLLIGIPVACWLAGVILYASGGALAFWRVFAYVAVFHFVRQQYGFVRLYSRREPYHWTRKLDAAAIYLSTIYPLIYWHAYGRSFQWFVKNDFFSGVITPGIERAAFWLYAATLAAYTFKELSRWRELNIPKNLIVLGTALSWYCGIVRHDGDLAFTATNVVAHGVPYMALVWMYQRKQRPAVRWFRPALLPVFVGVALAFAYFEEGVWDALVWRDHPVFFGWLQAALPKLEDPALLSVLVPLLALPQATHYVLDGFIWKVRDLYNKPA
jgi:hypothetical protein